MSEHAVQSSGRFAPRAVTFQWIGGVYLLILSLSLLVLMPGSLGGFLGLPWLRGALSALGGLTLFWAATSAQPRPVRAGLQVLAAIPQFYFAFDYARAGLFGAAGTLFVLAAGMVAAGLLPSPDRGRYLGPDLAGLFLGAAQAVQGLDLLLRPSAAGVVPAQSGVPPAALGVVFLVAGLGVVSVQFWVRCPSWLRWAVHIVAGLALLWLWTAQAALDDPVYWFVGAAAIWRGLSTALLPLLGPLLARVDPLSMPARFARVLIAASVVPLFLALAIIFRPGQTVASPQARQMAFATALLTTILAVAAGVLNARRLARPVDNLSTAVTRLEQGERPVKLPLHGPTEIVRLAAAVESLAASLDAEVAERERLLDELRATTTEAHNTARELAVYEERQRLSRELHDSVLQVFYSIALLAHSWQTYTHTDPERAERLQKQIVALAGSGLAELRALVFDLRPDAAAAEGLLAGLQRQTTLLQARYNLHVDLEIADEPALDGKAKIALYRVAQEALHNIARHAQATNVVVRLQTEAPCTVLDITDDGVGFDPAAVPPGHLGLTSMRERIESVGGRFELTSVPGAGVHVRASIPHI